MFPRSPTHHSLFAYGREILTELVRIHSDARGWTDRMVRRGQSFGEGRKTYVVDLADGNRRTDYVAVSNSVIGVVLLLLGGMGALAQAFSVPLVILVLSVLGLGGAVMSWMLPEVT